MHAVVGGFAKPVRVENCETVFVVVASESTLCVLIDHTSTGRRSHDVQHALANRLYRMRIYRLLFVFCFYH